MKPIKTNATNAVFKLPGGTDDNDLPCVRNGDGWVRSTYVIEEGDWTDEEQAGGDPNAVILHTWIPNLIEAELQIGGEKFTADEMRFYGETNPEGMRIISYVAPLDYYEIQSVLAGAQIEVGIYMDPTCPIGLTIVRID